MPRSVVAEVQPEAYPGEIGEHLREVRDEPKAMFFYWPGQVQRSPENRTLVGDRGGLVNYREPVKPEALESGEEV